MLSFKEYFNRPRIDDEFLRKLSESGDSSDFEDEMEAVFDSLVADSCDVDNAYASVCGNLSRKKKRRRFPRLAAIAAACVASVLLGIFFAENRTPSRVAEIQWEEVRVPHGQTRVLTLSDGTVISLNSGSRVTYPVAFSDTVRRIFLEGEAILRVTGNAERPFVVDAGDLSVRVLGTTFSIKSYHDSDCEEVLLMEGAVSLDIEGHRPVNMYPGNLVHYHRSSDKVEIDNFDVASFRGFDQGRSLHFFNMPLSEIALDLERIFDARIIVADSRLAESTFFAIFNNGESLYDILRVLNTEEKMKIEKKEKTFYITSN